MDAPCSSWSQKGNKKKIPAIILLCSGRDSKRTLPEYKPEASPIKLILSVLELYYNYHNSRHLHHHLPEATNHALM
jgi:transposase